MERGRFVRAADRLTVHETDQEQTEEERCRGVRKFLRCHKDAESRSNGERNRKPHEAPLFLCKPGRNAPQYHRRCRCVKYLYS